MLSIKIIPQTIGIAICLIIICIDKVAMGSLHQVASYNQSNELIRTISVDRNFVTIATHSSTNSNLYTFLQYDIALNIFYPLKANHSCSLTKLRERNGFNTLIKNFYMTVDIANTSVFSYNFTSYNASWIPSSNGSYDSFYGDAGQFYFEATQVANNTVVNKKYVLNNTVNSTVSYSSQKFQKFLYVNPRIYVLCSSISNSASVGLSLYILDQVAFGVVNSLSVVSSSNDVKNMHMCI